MKSTDEEKQTVDTEEQITYKGALFATTLFVGGGITAFIVLLFVLYMIRL